MEGLRQRAKQHEAEDEVEVIPQDSEEQEREIRLLREANARSNVIAGKVLMVLLALSMATTIYTAAWTPSSVISIVCLIQTVLSCFQLMPLSLEWQSDWPDRTRYQATNTMLQFLPSLLFTIASSKWEFLAICVSMSIALACYIQHDQEKKAEAALLDLERLKYDLKGA